MNILLGITGSIAAYKAIDLAKLCIADGFDVNIVLSKSAHNFISPLTLKSIFPGKVFASDDVLDQEGAMLHIKLAKQADIILLAPASANTIATIANGFADCLLSNICLASSAKILLAPAMNKQMWENAFVQQNITKLQQNGAEILGPGCGEQACGDVGYGRMLEPEEIFESLKDLFRNSTVAGNLYVGSVLESSCSKSYTAVLRASPPSNSSTSASFERDLAHTSPKLLLNKKIVITAGATREKLDPVRFISNYSSGKMGYAIAQIARSMGACVTLISGAASIPQPSGVEFIAVESAEEMFAAAQKAMSDADIFIGAAAVSDYKPKMVNAQKIKKSATSESALHLDLEKTVDIIATLKEQFPRAFFAGFAAETENLLANAQAKLKDKKMEMIIANDVSEGKVFGKDSNEVYILYRDRDPIFIPSTTKTNIARQILECINSLL